jgi:hypothetical protein
LKEKLCCEQIVCGRMNFQCHTEYKFGQPKRIVDEQTARGNAHIEQLKSDLELQIQGETWIMSKSDVKNFTQVSAPSRYS